MSTLRDVRDTIRYLEITLELFGCQGEFVEELVRKMQELREVFCRETGCSDKEVRTMPLETSLPKETETTFSEIKEWLSSQHEIFKNMAS